MLRFVDEDNDDAFTVQSDMSTVLAANTRRVTVSFKCDWRLRIPQFLRKERREKNLTFIFLLSCPASYEYYFKISPTKMAANADADDPVNAASK